MPLEHADSQLSDNELLKAPSGSVHEEVGLAMSPKVQEIQLESNNKKQVRKSGLMLCN